MGFKSLGVGTVATLLAAPTAAGCAGGDDPGLHVAVTGLPDEVAASVRVTGPDGFAETITGSTDLGDVGAGTYTVVVTPVQVSDAETPPGIGAGTWHPLRETQTVEVADDADSEAAAAYTTLIPDTTTIVDSAASGLVRPADATSTLVFDRDADAVQALQPGDVLIGEAGPQTPRGLLRKVLAVRPTGGTVEVDTRPATLPEAAPIGAFDVQAPLALPTGARGAAVGSGPLTYKLLLGSKVGMCRGPGEVSAGFDLGLGTPVLNFQSSWQGDEQQVRLTITFTQNATVSVKGGGNVSCTGETKVPAEPISLAAIPVPGAPGVVVTPQIDFPGTLSAGVKAGMTFDITQRATLTVGGEYVDGRPQPIADFSGDFDLATKPTGEFSVAAKGGIRMRFLVDQTAGPAVTLSAGVSGTVDHITPKYELKAGLYGGLSMDVTLFGYKDLATVEWPDLVKYEKVLWSLGNSSDPNGGGGGPTGTGSNGTGGSACPTVDMIEGAPGYLVPPDTTLNPLPDCYGGYALATALTSTGMPYAVLLRLDRLGWSAAVTDGDVCDLGMMNQAPLDVRQHYGCASSGTECGVIYDRVWEADLTVSVTAGSTTCGLAMRVMRDFLRSTDSYERYFRTNIRGWSCWDAGAQHPAKLVCEFGTSEISVTKATAA
jgi:hypothetical protein